MPEPIETVSGSFGASSLITAGLLAGPSYLTRVRELDTQPVSLGALLDWAAAERAIDAKAAQLGGLPGSPVADVSAVRNGWKRPYGGCDIYI